MTEISYRNLEIFFFGSESKTHKIYIIIRYILDLGPFGYLEPEILELELKTLKISENSKYI